MAVRRILIVINGEFLLRASDPEVHQFRLEFCRDHLWWNRLRPRLELIGERSRKLEVARKIWFAVFVSSQGGLIESNRIEQ